MEADSVTLTGPLTEWIQSLNQEQLGLLVAEANRLRYPEAVIVRGKLKCKCGHTGVPRLIEIGMAVTHRLETLSRKKITAQGWDGGSSDVSEEGEAAMLECTECFEWYRIPETTELEWL